jgi:AcrR family transcriptional regulator
MTMSTTRPAILSAVPAQAATRTEPVQQRSADRITNLLDTAAALIDERGIDGLTTSDVAVASGSSVGVVYRYFPNIQSLLTALATRNMRRFSERVFGSAPEQPQSWHAAANSAIDACVDLSRHEPGFRALGFGNVISRRVLQPEAGSNNAVLARAFNELLVEQYGLQPSDELAFDIEVVIEIGDALLNRAFLTDPEGDPRFIDKLRVIVDEYMAPHTQAARLAG